MRDGPTGIAGEVAEIVRQERVLGLSRWGSLRRLPVVPQVHAGAPRGRSPHAARVRLRAHRRASGLRRAARGRTASTTTGRTPGGSPSSPAIVAEQHGLRRDPGPVLFRSRRSRCGDSARPSSRARIVETLGPAESGDGPASWPSYGLRLDRQRESFDIDVIDAGFFDGTGVGHDGRDDGPRRLRPGSWSRWRAIPSAQWTRRDRAPARPLRPEPAHRRQALIQLLAPRIFEIE